MKISIVIAVLFLSACTGTKEVKEGAKLNLLPGSQCDAIQSFFELELDPYQDEIDLISKAYQEEQWRVETADPKASNEKMSKIFIQLQEKIYNKAILQKTLDLNQAALSLSDKECLWKKRLARVKQLLETSILTNEKIVLKEKENQDKQDALMLKSNAFRIQMEGEAEPQSKALYSKKLASTAVRSEREKMYKKFNSLRRQEWVKSGFVELVKSRNEEAKTAGFKDFYEYRFYRNQLNLSNYVQLVKKIKQNLSPKVKNLLKEMGKKEGIEKVQAWDMRYLREKASSGELNVLIKAMPETEVINVASRFYSSLGIDIDSYHFTMDLYPRNGKNTHAFAMPVFMQRVDKNKKVLPLPKADLRFLANLKMPVQWNDISTVIHELGHAVHFGEVKQPLGIFRSIGSVETEAIAMTLERMANHPDFIRKGLEGYSPKDGKAWEKILNRHVANVAKEQAFVLLRQVFFSDFECEFYKNPDQDLSKLWNKMHEEYWGITIPIENADWDIDHYVSSPVYIQNYAIGIVMVEQFFDTIVKRYKTTSQSTELGSEIKIKYFEPGIEFDYLELVRNFTGKELAADAALKLLK